MTRASDVSGKNTGLKLRIYIEKIKTTHLQLQPPESTKKNPKAIEQ